MTQIIYLRDRIQATPPKPVVATSAYLNLPLRTEAEVIRLREAVQLPVDCEDGGTAA